MKASELCLLMGEVVHHDPDATILCGFGLLTVWGKNNERLGVVEFRRDGEPEIRWDE